MSYRKFKGDFIFTGKEMLQDAVLITSDDGTIQDVTTVDEIGENIEVFNGIISPGFINTHCHLELSHMKDVIPPGSGLITFLTSVIKKRSFDQSIIDDAIKRAEDEIYESGTIAVADICNTTDTIPVKTNSKIIWRNFIEVIGFNSHPKQRFEYAKTLLEKFETKLPGYNSLTAHAPYSVSRQLFELLNEHSGKLFTIHNQETLAENELYLRANGGIYELYKELGIDADFFLPSGKTSFQTYLEWLDRPQNIILVHNTYLTKQDVEYGTIAAKQRNQKLYFSICINANQYIEKTNPPLEMLVQNHCEICIGTDSYASNSSLDMLNEIRKIQKEFDKFSLNEILRWATLNGAQALDLSDKLGSFEKNKKPGVIWISNIKNGKVTAASSSQRLL